MNPQATGCERSGRWVRCAAVIAAVSLFAPGDAFAIVGRPLTPVSYAGVARRTTRRSVAYGTTAAAVGAGVATGAAVGAAAAAATPVTVLPAGCTTVVSAGVTYQNCGGSYYRPYYQGPDVVYVPVVMP